MFRLVLIVIGIFFCFVLSYQNYKYPQLKFNRLEQRLLHPFDMRVRYRIGEIDPRFGLSEQEVKNLAQRATYIWQRDTGKSWFVYDEDARLTINFIFDERQQNTRDFQQAEQHINHIVHQHEQSSHSLNQSRESLNREFASLQAEIDSLNQQYAQLKVEFVQASPEQRQQLEFYIAQLEQKRTELKQKKQKYQDNQQRFNQQVNAYNQNAQHVNATILQAKEKFRPREFHKGVFNGREINIYEYQSQDDLLLTLAHEFGHALDLDHNDDPTALMYPMAQQQDLANFRLKPADIKMLER